MRTGGPTEGNFISLKCKLKELRIYSLSLKSQFRKRKIKKIDALNLIISFYSCGLNGVFSLSGWALQLGVLINKSITKQAIFDRVDSNFIKLCRELLQNSLKSRLRGGKLLKRFKNVYIQDSVHQRLPRALYPFYPGNGSLTGLHSIIKIQVIFNLLKNSFEELSLSPYTRNDQAASKDILKLLRPGDLVLRDLGYFVLSSLKEIAALKAHFICPVKKNVGLFDAKTGQPLKLKRLLKNRAYLKIRALIGNEQKLPVTLVAVKLDQNTARYRRRTACNNRDRRVKCKTEEMYLLDWDIFVSSCEDLTPKEVQSIYRVRWQIEIIFKSWKSHLKIERNIPPRLQRPYIPETIIYLTLLLVTIFIMPIYRWARKIISEVSLLKLTRFIATVMPQNNWKFSSLQLQSLQGAIAYEKRSRLNFCDKLRLLT